MFKRKKEWKDSLELLMKSEEGEVVEDSFDKTFN